MPHDATGTMPASQGTPARVDKIGLGREANSQAEVIQAQARWTEAAAALNTLPAKNRGQWQCAHGSTEADADSAESPPRPRTMKWQPTWEEVDGKNGNGQVNSGGGLF